MASALTDEPSPSLRFCFCGVSTTRLYTPWVQEPCLSYSVWKPQDIHTLYLSCDKESKKKKKSLFGWIGLVQHFENTFPHIHWKWTLPSSAFPSCSVKRLEWQGGLQRDYSSHDSVEPCRGKVGGLRSVLVLTPAQLASSQERLALQFCVQWHHTDSLGVKGENKFTKFWGNCLKVRRIIEISGGRNDPLMLGPFLYRGCERP